MYSGVNLLKIPQFCDTGSGRVRESKSEGRLLAGCEGLSRELGCTALTRNAALTISTFYDLLLRRR